MDKPSGQLVRRLLSAEVAGHPLVWSATTGLFILVGYLWLQHFAKPYASGLQQEDAIGLAQSSQWNPEIYREVKTELEMGITDGQDDPRSAHYRHIIAIEAKITPLLQQASLYMAEGKFAGFEGENAWNNYQKILEIDPENSSAKLGSNEILSLLQGRTEQAIDQRKYEEAERWLTQLDEIQPYSSFQHEQRLEITEQIKADLAEQERQQKERDRLTRLKTALDQAHAVFKADPPEARAAYDLYQVALEIDPDNPIAQSGIRKIKRFHAKQIHRYIAAKQFDAAKLELARLDEIKGDQADIKTLRLMLANASAKAEKEAKQVQLALSDPQTEIEATSEPKPVSAPIQTSSTDLNQTESVAVESIDINKPTEQPINAVSSSSNDRATQLQKGIQAYYAGNYNDAFEWLHPLAQDGIARAQFRIGIMYFQGRTVVKNKDVAAQWIGKALPTIIRAAQDNTAWAQSDLGTAYELGIALKKDMARAASWYSKAANNGYAGAQTNLGVLYGMGDGVEYDRQLAVYWLKKAAAQGDKIAQDNLEILSAR